MKKEWCITCHFSSICFLHSVKEEDPICDQFMESLIEYWRDIPGSIYAVSSHGRIRNNKTNHVKKLWKHYKGHLKIALKVNGKRKNFFVHRLVAIAFIPNPDNLSLVDHLDEDKANPHKDNLEWVTVSENTQRYYDRKRIKEGVLDEYLL